MKNAFLFSTLVLATSTLSVRAAPIFTDTFQQSYQVDPAAKIHIRNRDGSIWIYGAATNEMKVEAIKKAFSEQRLNAISVNVSIKAGEVSIDTQFPPQPKWGLADRSGTVDYVITIPWTCSALRVELANGEVWLDGMRCGTTDASLGSGRFFAHNCFTQLHANIASGRFDSFWEWWEPQRFSISATIVDGDLHTEVPPGAAFHLLAASTTGEITIGLPQLESVEEVEPPKIDIMVGGGSQAELNLKATNGNIYVTGASP